MFVNPRESKDLIRTGYVVLFFISLFPMSLLYYFMQQTKKIVYLIKISFYCETVKLQPTYNLRFLTATESKKAKNMTQHRSTPKPTANKNQPACCGTHAYVRDQKVTDVPINPWPIRESDHWRQTQSSVYECPVALCDIAACCHTVRKLAPDTKRFVEPM